ncbi:hypothetical protein B0T13DRAFT_400776 [Neurospora crassa]|nr:hypothetical protein B0T13DRAFT_400776 [Neurospora crassa]
MGGNRETYISNSGSRPLCYNPRTTSPSSSSNSRASANSVFYRSGTADNHNVTTQKKSDVVVINHHQLNPAKDEPRSLDYYRR